MKKEPEPLQDIYLQKLANRIRTLRKQKDISQENLALESNIARSLMYAYETGKRNIAFVNLVKITKNGLNITLKEFFAEGFEDEQPAKKKKK